MVLEGNPCLVIGGGSVAARKVHGLLDAGAAVTVISPDACRKIESSAKRRKIRLLRRSYKKGDLKGMTLAFVATSDGKLNRKIATDARKAKVPVNVADDPGNCDFMLPSILRRGEVVIAVGTGGASPLLAKKLRDKIQEAIGPEYGLLNSFLGDIRKKMAGLGISPKARRAMFEYLIESDLADCLKRKDFAGINRVIGDFMVKIKTLTGE